MKRATFASLAVLSTLAGCGGSDDSSPPPVVLESAEELQNRTATGSIAGLIGVARTLIAQATNETAEPRAIDKITPPISESDEPTVL